MDPDYATRFKDFSVPSARARARGLALNLLAGTKLRSAAYQELLQTPRVHFLYLHYVFQDEEAGFDKFLNWLDSHNHSLISYSEAVRRAEAGEIDRPYVCFSFDDGVDNCLKASQMLEAHGTTACFFLNGCNLAEEHVIKPMLYSRRHHGRKPARYLSLTEVEQIKNAGHELGGHTFSHINLAETPAEEIAADLHRNRAFLEPRFGTLEHFSWPFGRFACFNQAARSCVRKAGYRSIASAERGVHRSPGGEGVCILRDNIVGAWPLNHCLYLMALSIAHSTLEAPNWKQVLSS